MSNQIWGGRALILVSAVTLLIFTIHPTHVDEALIFGPWGLSGITHSIGLMIVPMMAYGNWSLAEWLGLNRPIVRVALILNLIAATLMICAALVRGWVTPVGIEGGESFGQLAVAFNRAFDRGYVGFSAAGMLLNGLALPRTHTMLRMISFPISCLPLVWIISGMFDPNVHAMLLLAAVQGLWLVLVGMAMIRASRDQSIAAGSIQIRP